MYMFGNLGQRTVEELKMFFAPVVTTSLDAKGFEAFKTMHEKVLQYSFCWH